MSLLSIQQKKKKKDVSVCVSLKAEEIFNAYFFWWEGGMGKKEV